MIYYILALFGLLFGFIVGDYIKKNILLNGIHGPSSTYVRSLIFKNKNSECYKLEPVMYVCPISLSMKKNNL